MNAIEGIEARIGREGPMSVDRLGRDGWRQLAEVLGGAVAPERYDRVIIGEDRGNGLTFLMGLRSICVFRNVRDVQEERVDVILNNALVQAVDPENGKVVFVNDWGARLEITRDGGFNLTAPPVTTS